MNNLSRFLAPAAALLLASACSGSNDSSTRHLPLDSAKLVSSSGKFGLTKGELDVAVSPRDKEGNFIGTDLPKSAFSFNNVKIKRQSSTTAPEISVDTEVTDIEVREPKAGGALTGVVVFDSSGSMSGNDPGRVGRKAGGEAVFSLVGESDEVAVLDFGAGKDNMLQSSRLLQDFTNDQSLLVASLDKLKDSGGTPLYGSLLDALGLLEAKQEKGGSIIVLTDGQSSSDTAKVDEVIAQATAQEVPVFAIGLGDTLSFDELERLGNETGGALATATQASSLGDVFDGIGTGVSSGRVIVHGEGTYDALTVNTVYKVTGELVTEDGAESVTTPFEFLVKATAAGMETLRVVNDPNL